MGARERYKMRVVLQRVSEAKVEVIKGEIKRTSGKIGAGLLLLIGVGSDDTEEDAKTISEKIANLRIFEDEAGKLNLSLLDIGGEALVVSNFTLYGDCRKGRRPSFTEAAPGESAEALYEIFGNFLESQGVPTQFGVFGATMQVSLVNDGPVTLLLDSRKGF